MRPFPPFRRTSVLAALLLSSLSAFCASVKIGNAGRDLYAKENDEGSKVATLPSGTVLEKVGEGAGGWIKVKAPTVDCWIFSDTVSGDRVTSSRGRVRAEPHPTSYEIAILPRGARIEPRGKQGEWTKIAPPVDFWVKPDSVKETKESPTRAPAVKPPVVVPPPEPPKAEPPKPVVAPPPEPVAVEPPKPTVAEPPKPVAVEPPKPVFPAIPEPVKPEPEYADPAELHAKWEPPKETPVKPVPQPVVSPAPIEVVRTPAPKPVPTPPPAAVPEPPKPAPVATAPKPVAPPVRHDPPPTAAPAPASGPTITWNSPSSRATPPTTQRTANPPVVHPRPHSTGLVAAPQDPVSTSGWESPAAVPAMTAAPAAPPARSTGSGATSLPKREFSPEWEDPTPGTLLSRKKPSNKNLRSAPPAGISPDRLRRDVFQGDVGHATGVLFRGGGGWGFRMKPSEFELRTVHEDGSSELVAYVHGSDAALSPYLNRTVRVEGTCWWLGDSDALLVPTVPIQIAH